MDWRSPSSTKKRTKIKKPVDKSRDFWEHFVASTFALRIENLENVWKKQQKWQDFAILDQTHSYHLWIAVNLSDTNYLTDTLIKLQRTSKVGVLIPFANILSGSPNAKQLITHLEITNIKIPKNIAKLSSYWDGNRKYLKLSCSEYEKFYIPEPSKNVGLESKRSFCSSVRWSNGHSTGFNWKHKRP